MEYHMELVRKLSWWSNDIRLIGPTTKLLGAGTVINYRPSATGLFDIGKKKTEGGQGNCSIPKAAAGKGGWTTLLAQGGHDPETPVTHQVHISDGSDCQASEQTLSGTWSLTSRAGLTNAWQEWPRIKSVGAQPRGSAVSQSLLH